MAGLGHMWEETLGALPDWGADAQLPCVCGTSCH